MVIISQNIMAAITEKITVKRLLSNNFFKDKDLNISIFPPYSFF